MYTWNNKLLKKNSYVTANYQCLLAILYSYIANKQKKKVPFHPHTPSFQWLRSGVSPCPESEVSARHRAARHIYAHISDDPTIRDYTTAVHANGHKLGDKGQGSTDPSRGMFEMWPVSRNTIYTTGDVQSCVKLTLNIYKIYCWGHRYPEIGLQKNNKLRKDTDWV
ncbi:hypothetical protein Btru_058146 [Bulinus truncatus]|nr:hypothetical protein Btru_058146 [Bulinus truncatus]